MADSIPSANESPKPPDDLLPPRLDGYVDGVTKAIPALADSPLTLQELHLRLDQILERWIFAACAWRDDDWDLGQYRWLTFQSTSAEGLGFFMQLWSDPFEKVLWEAVSGHESVGLEAWLAGARDEKIRSFGFTTGGDVNNYRQTTQIVFSTEYTQMARNIVALLYHGYDYRGTASLNVELRQDTWAMRHWAITWLTVEDLKKVFSQEGHHLAGDNQDEERPVLRFRYGRVITTAEFINRVGKTRFATVIITCTPSMRSSEGEAPKQIEMRESLDVGPGVGLPWVPTRVKVWTETLWKLQQAHRPPRPSAEEESETAIQ